MNQLTQSPFLQALGYAIINSLWQFALLWLVYVLASSVFKLNSHQKSGTALSLQFTGFAWITGTLIFYYGECSRVAEGFFATISPDGSSAVETGLSVKDWLISFVFKGERLLPYLSLAYIFLLIFLSLKTIQCYRNTQRIRTQGLKKINVEWRLFVQKVSLQLGIKREVKIYLSSLIHSPLTVGFIKPLILLPIATLNNLNTEQVEAVLLHELAHIKRNDYLVNLLLAVVEITLFFNPFMQLIGKQIKRERENSCDDWVLQYQYNAASYAKALLTIARNKTNSTAILAMNATDNNQALLIRVKRMIEKNDKSVNYRQQLIALILMTGLISSIAWLTPGRSFKNAGITGNATKTSIQQPLAVKINNPLFNPVFFLAEKEEKEIIDAFKKERTTINKKEEVTFNPTLFTTVSSLEKKVLKQISKPVVKNTDPLQAGTLFSNASIVDTVFKVKNLVAKQSLKVDWEKVEKELERVNKQLQNTGLKLNGNAEKVQQDLLLALEEIRKMQLKFDLKQIDLIRHTANVEMGKAEMEMKEKAATKFPKMEMKKLAENIKQQLIELEQQKEVFRNSVDFNLQFEIPQLLNSPKPDEAGNWSYTYSRRPRQLSRQERRVAPKPATEIKSDVQLLPGARIEQSEATPHSCDCNSSTKKAGVKRISIIRI